MTDPKLFIEGPFDSSGTSFGPNTPLYLANSADVNTDTETNKTDIPGQDANETILSPLEAQRSFNFDGVINPTRLYQAGYGDTPTESFVQYVLELESFVKAFQRRGYRLVDEMNGVVLDPLDGVGVLAEELTWEINGGDGLRGEWTCELTQSEGVQETTGGDVVRRTYPSNPLGEFVDEPENQLLYEGNSIPLGSLDSLTVSRSVDLDAQDLMHQFDTPQVGVIESGVEVEITYSGTVTQKELDQPLSEWASELGFDAHGVESQFEEVVTGRRFAGTLSDTNTSFEDESPNSVSFDLTFEVGAAELFS